METLFSRKSLIRGFFYLFYVIISMKNNVNTSTDIPTQGPIQSGQLENSIREKTLNDTNAAGFGINDTVQCPNNLDCNKLLSDCIDCKFNSTCVYGVDDVVDCQAKPYVNCNVMKPFKRSFNCRYCYQLDPSNYRCNQSVTCSVTKGPRKLQTALCIVNSNVLCMGKRKFLKMVPCNWSSGYKWSTALILSIMLGGFGADRFYLGLWKEGIGKLFSFGGLGVWTIVDVVLIAVGYITPADGSLYL